ncbi:MAG: TonB family protein [Lacunisphaera sp.]
MNKDLIVGIAVSLALHSSIIVFSRKNVAPPRFSPPKEESVQLEMPPLEEEKEDKIEELNNDPVENLIAPPSLQDTPTIVPVDAFTQTLAPPPPPGLTPSKGAITIPVNKPGANFGKGISNLFNIGDLDQQPVARVRQAPTYPYDMRRAGINGTVVVEFIINTEGDVIQTNIVRSSTASSSSPRSRRCRNGNSSPVARVAAW